MAVRIQHLRGTAAEWAALNPILKPGELGFEKDTKVMKLGDGVTPWNSLDNGYLRKAGGTMTGALSLIAPTADAHPVRLQDLNAAELGLRQIVKFVLNGTFDKGDYPWLRAVRIKLVGGGGGGGGSGLGGGQGGGGGAGGGYAESMVLVDNLGSSETVTVGIGGNGGANAGVGGTGGTSSLGAHASATGGTGGSHGDASKDGGTGGIGTAGDVLIKGQGGNVGIAGQSTPGAGGSSQLGGGARSKSGSGSGESGGQYGGGGAGGSRVASGGVTGGAGAAGIVIVELYG